MAGGPVFDDDFRARFTELLRWRRDVRHFRTDPLPDGALDAILDLAMLSPSVGYSQPWRFVIVEDADRRARVRANFEACNQAAMAGQQGDRRAAYARLKLAGLVEAPVHLAVFADDDTATGAGLGRQTMPETLRYSVVMAIYTLWLAARIRGVGVGWVSILDPARIKADLDIPAGWSFVAYLCLGQPAEDHDRPELERVGWAEPDPAARHILRR